MATEATQQSNHVRSFAKTKALTSKLKGNIKGGLCTGVQGKKAI